MLEGLRGADDLSKAVRELAVAGQARMQHLHDGDLPRAHVRRTEGVAEVTASNERLDAIVPTGTADEAVHDTSNTYPTCAGLWARTSSSMNSARASLPGGILTAMRKTKGSDCVMTGVIPVQTSIMRV